jgi:hypothetical protein
VPPTKRFRGPDAPTDDANTEERLVQIEEILRRLRRTQDETAKILREVRATRLQRAKAGAARKKR